MGMPAEHLPDPLDVHVAPFQGDEVEAIAELCRDCATRPEDSLGGWEWGDAAELARQLEQWEVSPRSTLFVARADGRVIGFCGVECYPRARIGLVHGPVVAPASRGRGVSKALFEVALRNGVSNGAAELWAATGRDNRRAQALYERGGLHARRGHRALPARSRRAHAARRCRSTSAASPRTTCPRCSRSPRRSATTCT